MRFDPRLFVGLGVLLTLSAVVPGQPPAPTSEPRGLPPALTGQPIPVPPMVTPASAQRTKSEPPLAKFEPLLAFPHHTQLAVRGAVLGGNWISRMNQPHGRFIYSYIPALRRAGDGESEMAQAWAAVAAAESARFTGDDRQAAVAAQAVLVLLAATKPDPADATVRTPVRASKSCNRVGFAGALVLAIHALPSPDETLLAEAEKLSNFIRKQLRPDGSVHYTDDPAEVPAQVDPAGLNEYPGTALTALAVSNRSHPTPWKQAAVTAAVKYYGQRFRANPNPMLAASLTPAFVELYLQAKDDEAAAGVFEMNDWLAGQQYSAADPQNIARAGGFRVRVDAKASETVCGAEGGIYLRSLAFACQMSRQVPDVKRHDRYRQACIDAVGYLSALQYGEENTRHFEAAFAANTLAGGFHNSATDGDLRIDRTAACVSGMVRFLAIADSR